MSQDNIIRIGRRAQTTVRRGSFLPQLAPPEASETGGIRRTGQETNARKTLIETIIFGAALVVSAALGFVMGNLL